MNDIYHIYSILHVKCYIPFSTYIKNLITRKKEKYNFNIVILNNNNNHKRLIKKQFFTLHVTGRNCISKSIYSLLFIMVTLGHGVHAGNTTLWHITLVQHFYIKDHMRI